MTQAIALATSVSPAAAALQLPGAAVGALQTGATAGALQAPGTAVAAGEAFAAALAELLGLAAPATGAVATNAPAHAQAPKVQQGSRQKPGSNENQPDAALVAPTITPVTTVAAVAPAALAATTDQSSVTPNQAEATRTRAVSSSIPTLLPGSVPTPSAAAPQPVTSNLSPAAPQLVPSKQDAKAGGAAPAATPAAQNALSAPALNTHQAAASVVAAPNAQAAATAQLVANAQLVATTQLAASAAVPAHTMLANAIKAAQKPAPGKPALAAPASAKVETSSGEPQAAGQKPAAGFEAVIQRAFGDAASANAPQSGGGNANTNTPAQQLAASAAPVVVNFQSSDVQPATTQSPAAAVAIPLDALAVHIARKFEAGESRFDIRLDPAELGKLDISLTVADDGRVQAVVRAERPTTLDMLQQDARLLESQLRQSGLNVDSNSLNFSLGGGSGQRQAFADNGQSFVRSLASEPEFKPIATANAVVSLRDGVDIRI